MALQRDIMTLQRDFLVYSMKTSWIIICNASEMNIHKSNKYPQICKFEKKKKKKKINKKNKK